MELKFLNDKPAYGGFLNRWVECVNCHRKVRIRDMYPRSNQPYRCCGR